MKTGFIGCGNMAAAIINGIIASEILKKEDIFVYDIDKNKSSEINAVVCDKIDDLLLKSDVIFLCVKPNVLLEVLKSHDFSNKAVVSIAAGITSRTLQENLPNSRILRIMPNTPLMVNQGTSCFETPSTLLTNEYEFVHEIFSKLGVVQDITPDYMNEITGISGSGPAYVYMFVDALAKAGEKQGLSKEISFKLALNTFMGACEMLKKTNTPPDALIKNVCSPGGTTIEAMKVFEENNVYDIVNQAVTACVEKSRELSNEKK